MKRPSAHILFLIGAIAMISLNLRPSISAVGPLVFEIRAETGLSNTSLGLLTTLPILCFGLFSVFTPLITRKAGTEGTMFIALLVLTAGVFLRVVPSITALFAGTIVLGMGIASINVLLPGIVKKSFPHRSGMVTGIYSGMLGVGAALGAGLSVPVSIELGFGWRWALGYWGFFSLLALLMWLPQLKQTIPVIPRRSIGASVRRLLGKPLARQITLFMGMQSITFFIIIAWLPELLISRGFSPGEAGWLAGLCQGAGVLGTFFVPNWAASRPSQQQPVVILVIVEIVCIVLLMVPGLGFAAVWVTLLGISMGGSFGLALLFIVLRTDDTESANELSGVAQSFGYTIAAAGPALFGFIFDIAGNWLVPLGMLLIFSILKMVSGYLAGRNQILDSYS
ncbi:MAG: CynX/NimT family MFS transporter [Balneolaceae bacterium]